VGLFSGASQKRPGGTNRITYKGPPVADQWYFAWDDHSFGPFSAAQLKELAGLGRLQPTDIVWKESRAKGTIAGNVKHLFPDARALVLPVSVCPPAPAEHASEAHSSGSGQLQPYVVSTLDERTPEEKLCDTIPDGLALRVLPD
jgi:uncharacterized protein DUF4339